jgi:hypothetical protein
MPRKRKKKNMYDDASMFNIHVFIQSGGVNTRVNASVPVIEEAPVETDLEIIVEEIMEWFNSDSYKNFTETRRVPDAITTCFRFKRKLIPKVTLRHHEGEIRKFHCDHKITDFLWKRRKKDAKI